jgi:hypothetical protein
MMQDKDRHDYWDQWEKLFEVAAAFQGLLPGAVLIMRISSDGKRLLPLSN